MNATRYFSSFKIYLRAFLVPTLALACTPAIALDLKAWESSFNPETKERYIPVELWTGAEWDGKRELKMAPVEGIYKHETAQYQIKGPMEWKNSVNGQIFLAYERTNPGKDGVKIQMFTINQDQTGLGRLYDGRPGRDTRTSSGVMKFPLGLWKDGETKKFAYKVYDEYQQSNRVEAITIKQIDFVFQGNPHCLQFYWTVSELGKSKMLDRHTYIYCPGKSMVSQIQH